MLRHFRFSSSNIFRAWFLTPSLGIIGTVSYSVQKAIFVNVRLGFSVNSRLTVSLHKRRSLYRVCLILVIWHSSHIPFSSGGFWWHFLHGLIILIQVL